MKYALVATVMAFVIISMGSLQAQPGCTTDELSSLCAREKGLCGLATRALDKGTVLLGYTRDNSDCPSSLRVHVFQLNNSRDPRARISAFLYPQDNPSAGRELNLRRYGSGQYMTPINWDTTVPMELAVRTARRGMPDETSYFMLLPDMEPQTR